MAGSDHHHISPFCLLLNQLLLKTVVVNRWLTRKHAWLPRLFHLAFQWGRLEGPGCCPRDLGRGKEPHCFQPNQGAPEAARQPVLVWHSGFRKAHAQLLSRIQLFATPWTGAHQAPPSMGFPKQEYWSGRPCPPPRGLPDPGIAPGSPVSPALAGRFFTTEPPGKPHFREAGKDNYSPPWVCLKGHLRPQGRQPGQNGPRCNSWAGLNRGRWVGRWSRELPERCARHTSNLTRSSEQPYFTNEKISTIKIATHHSGLGSRYNQDLLKMGIWGNCCAESMPKS